MSPNQRRGAATRTQKGGCCLAIRRIAGAPRGARGMSRLASMIGTVQIKTGAVISMCTANDPGSSQNGVITASGGMANATTTRLMAPGPVRRLPRAAEHIRELR